ncbi:MAG: DNA starvation/stationary phase protection protein Dps [Acidobacteriota bacterium]
MITATKNLKHPTLSPVQVEQVGRSLQELLASLIDLQLSVKQAHWNVVGPRFDPIHPTLDKIHATLTKYVDEVAERLPAVGVPADGRVGTVAAQTKLAGFPAGFIGDEQALREVLERLEIVIRQARGAREDLAAADPVSEDLVLEMLGELEKQAWMLRSQLRS